MTSRTATRHVPDLGAAPDGTGHGRPRDSAAAVFGPALATAGAFADVLATRGVEQGLIGPREVPRLWDRHLLNCAVVAELVDRQCTTLVDIGSGAGLPGMVLAMVLPEVMVTLLEPMERRCRFLSQCAAELGLANVSVVRSRAEDAARAGLPRADVATARAVAPLPRLAELAARLVRPGGMVLAIKGSTAAGELKAAAPVLRRIGAHGAEVVRAGQGKVVPATTVVRFFAQLGRAQVGLSYHRQGTAGLGWPQEPPTGVPEDTELAGGVAGIGGLGWPTANGGPDPGRPHADRGSRGVQVNGDESEAGGDGRGRPYAGRGTRARREDPAAAAPVSPGTRSVVIPEVLSDAADTPIGRAAEAAVVVRGMSDHQLWPRPFRCRVMTIANQKGGVGKTTTAVNLAAALAQHGSRVLVLDLDPQGNASTALDVEHHAGVPSIYDVLVDDRPLAEVVRPAGDMPGLYCAPATIDLAGAEIELVPVVARELRLARALRAFDMSQLDYVFVDCPPSLGLLTVNALVAAEEVLLPIQCEYYALEGVQQLLNTAELVRVNFNPGLHVSTVLLTMYDGRTRLASDVADDVRAHFGASVLHTIIPRSVRVSEAPSRGQSVITYDPASSGAVAYMEAARELAMQSAGTV